MEPSLLSGKLEVCAAATLNHYSPLPSNCNALCSGLKWAQNLISHVSQVFTTLSLTWTLTRNGPGHEALSRMGSASTELTAAVLTTPLTGKHNLAEPGSLNSAIVYSSFLPESSGRSPLGLTPGAGSTPYARGSWSKTGRGTGLLWTTSSSTIRRPNFEKLTNDACCRMQPSRFCRLLGWALLYRNTAHPREADIVCLRIMVLRACICLFPPLQPSTLS
jgi:hypothetical protein